LLKKIIKVLLKLFVSIFFLYLIFKEIDYKSLNFYGIEKNYFLIISYIFLVYVQIICYLIRCEKIFEYPSDKKLVLHKINLSSFFIGSIIPVALSSEIYRIIKFKNILKINGLKVSKLILADKLNILFVYLITLNLLLLLLFHENFTIVSISIIFALLFFLLLKFNYKILIGKKLTFAYVLLILSALVANVISGLMLFSFFSISENILILITIIIVGFIFKVLPISYAGIGVYDFAMLKMASYYSIDKDIIFSMTALTHILYFVGILPLIIFLLKNE